MNAEKLGPEPSKVDRQIRAVGADNLLDTVTTEIELETHNESKKEEEEITDISGIETCTEPEENKLNEDKAEIILDLIVGGPNIVKDKADKPEPKMPANSGDTCSRWSQEPTFKVLLKSVQ